jgi:homoaconitase/3-isopropylmalate dehydratase large subunit
MSVGVTMFDKIWRRHVVAEGPGEQVLVYVDRHLLHEGSGAAFDRLGGVGRRVRRPESCFATADPHAHGFRAFIAPSFGDILFGSCANNGTLPIVLPTETVAGIRRQLHARPGATMVVDLPSQTVTGPDGARHEFAVDAFRKECLLTGQDEIALTLGHEAAIAAFEAKRDVECPWLVPGKRA